MAEHQESNPGGVAFYTSKFFGWCAANPLPAALLGAVVGTLVYFFAFVPLYVLGSQTTVEWARHAWNPDLEQDYCAVVPFISLFLIWYHREQLRAAPKAGSNKGLVFVAIGILFFVLGARCVQPRMALISVPFLVYGGAMFLWGRPVARVILFLCAFLVFMIPVGALEQMTSRLQGMVTPLVGVAGNIAGLNIRVVGTTIMAADGKFNFQVAEGCSGIRSLVAMIMLTSIYLHLTQKVVWKKIAILLSSIVFAIIGNAGRIFTTIVGARMAFWFGYTNSEVGKVVDQYHHYLGFISFPFAMLAMIGFSKLLDLDLKKLAAPEDPKPGAGHPSAQAPKEAKYDY